MWQLKIERAENQRAL